jgi:hypothetical protein
MLAAFGSCGRAFADRYHIFLFSRKTPFCRGNPAEIIQRLRDSEINGSIARVFDGLWRWRIGGDNDWRFEGRADDLESAVRALAEKANAAFPQSTFATWWTKVGNG